MRLIDIDAFRKDWGLAERCEDCERDAAKGKMLAVKGRAQIDSYKGKDGQTRKAFVVIADQVQFIEWPGRDQKPQPKKPVEIDEEPFGFQALDADIPF